jgi:hypothetical protein
MVKVKATMNLEINLMRPYARVGPGLSGDLFDLGIYGVRMPVSFVFGNKSISSGMGKRKTRK